MSVFNPSEIKIFQFIKITIILFMLTYFLLLWVAPAWNWVTTKSQVLLLVLLSILARSKDIDSLLNYNHQIIKSSNCDSRKL